MVLFTIGLILFMVGSAMFFLSVSVREVPADPLHVAVVTRFGTPINKVKKAGNRLFPFYPFGIYGAIPIVITKVTHNFLVEKLRAGADTVEFDIEMTVTWTPDEDNAMEYVQSGRTEGINKIVTGQISELLRKWAKNTDKDWQAILQADDEVNEHLIRKIAGISTKDKTAEAQGLIEKINNGSANQPIQSLGIRLQRLHLAKIAPAGRFAEIADMPAAEKKRMQAEQVRMSGFAERVEQLVTLNIPREMALDLLQMERGYAQRKLSDVRGLTSEQVAAAQRVLAIQSNT